MASDEREEARALARDVLFSIEKDTGQVDQLVLKATRLARLMRDEDAGAWLTKERQGFGPSDRGTPEFNRDHRGYEEERYDVYSSALSLPAEIEAAQNALAAMSVNSLSGDGIITASAQQRTAIGQRNAAIVRMQRVSAAIKSEVHSFAVRVYHTLEFEKAVGDVFVSAREDIESLLVTTPEDVTRKLDFAMHNLEDGSPEAVSAATNSLRRLLTVFIDRIFPPTSDTRPGGDGVPIQLGQQQYLNRAKAYIDDHCASDGRRKGLKQKCTYLNTRLSAGVHDEVDASEARFLALEVYTLCGELLSLSSDALASGPNSGPEPGTG